jgi:pimeloyl-ACP methyl ester carboxylesterase
LRTPWNKKYSPAHISEKRRKHWSDAEAALAHFAAKEKFAIWSPEVLRDYIQNGLVKDEQGVTLRFTREIETEVYLALPDHLEKLTYGKLPVPVGYIGGTESIEARMADLTATKRMVGEHFVQIEAGHLLPLEVPEQTAMAVHAMIQSLLSDKKF